MRRKFLALTFAGLLALGACGGDDADSASGEGDSKSSEEASSSGNAVEDAKDCAALVKAAQPVFTELFQGLVDSAQELSAEELAAMATDAEGSNLMSDFTEKLEKDGAAIEEKANELDCSEEDAQEAMCNAVAAVKSDGNIIADSMIQGMAAECS